MPRSVGRGDRTLAVLVAISLTTLVGLYVRSTSRHAAREAPAPIADFVIEPGHEAQVIEWLRPLGGALGPSGRITAIRIDRATIVAGLAGADGAAGAMVITRIPNATWRTRAAFAGSAFASRSGLAIRCDACAPLLAAAVGAELLRLIDRPEVVREIWSTAPVNILAYHRPGGMLQPMAARLRVSIRALAIGAVLGAALLSVFVGFAAFARRTPTDAAPRGGRTVYLRWRTVAVAVCIVSVAAMYVLRARTIAIDTDEQPGGVYQVVVLGEDHEGWIHPPMYRAVQRTGIPLGGVDPVHGLFRLRRVSLVAATLAFAIVAWLAATGSTRPLALAPLAILAAPSVTENVLLARPYGLAVFLVSVTLLCVVQWRRGARGGTVWVAMGLVASGCAIWTDFLAGTMVSALWLATALAAAPSTNRVAAVCAVAVLIVLGAWGGWFVPGVLHSLRDRMSRESIVAPQFDDVGVASGSQRTRAVRVTGAIVPDRPRPLRRLAHTLNEVVWGEETENAAATLIALALIAAIVAVHHRRKRDGVALAFALMLAAIVIYRLKVVIRPRNFVAARYLWVYLLAATIEPVLERLGLVSSTASTPALETVMNRD